MGLDQYAYRVRKEAVKNDLGFEHEIDGEETWERIYYWRKVPALQGFMEELYYKKGGEDTFNCEYVRLDLEDLERLKNAVENNNMPIHTTGFFFGKHYDEDMPSVLKFVDKAKEVIENGDAVYYSSWW